MPQIESLHVFIYKESRVEGICHGRLPNGQFAAMVIAYEDSLNVLIGIAKQMVTENNQRIKLVKFTNRQDVLENVLSLTAASTVGGDFFTLTDVCAFISEDDKEESFCSVRIILDGQAKAIMASGNTSDINALINQAKNMAKINGQSITFTHFTRKQDFLGYLMSVHKPQDKNHPLKIEKLYAFIFEGSNGEDICGMEFTQNGQLTITPTVAADVGYLYSLLSWAQEMSAKTSQNIKLAKFTHREVLMEFTPTQV